MNRRHLVNMSSEEEDRKSNESDNRNLNKRLVNYTLRSELDRTLLRGVMPQRATPHNPTIEQRKGNALRRVHPNQLETHENFGDEGSQTDMVH